MYGDAISLRSGELWANEALVGYTKRGKVFALLRALPKIDLSRSGHELTFVETAASTSP